MLQKNEVEPGTVELLKKVCSLNSMVNFALGGGTNLALRMGHRLSVDQDFFTNAEFNNALVFQTIIPEFQLLNCCLNKSVSLTVAFHSFGVQANNKYGFCT